MTPICPRCEAERALQDMRAMYDWEPAPDVNMYAHAAGMAEGSLTLLLDCPLELCARHGNTGRGNMTSKAANPSQTWQPGDPVVGKASDAALVDYEPPPPTGARADAAMRVALARLIDHAEYLDGLLKNESATTPKEMAAVDPIIEAAKAALR